jgi:hypothetical protein
MKTVACALSLCLLAMSSGCGHSAQRQARAGGVPVLRAIWRDGSRHLLVAMPDGPRGLPRGDCAAPLLIDDATGGVRQITPAQAAEWVKRMQLSAAVHGTCL